MTKQGNEMQEVTSRKRWTTREDKILLEEIRKSPYNLRVCFMEVSKKTGRSVGATANHWYTVVSKRPGVLELGTISSKHFAKNRKNGRGVDITTSIWRRFLLLVKKYI